MDGQKLRGISMQEEQYREERRRTVYHVENYLEDRNINGLRGQRQIENGREIGLSERFCNQIRFIVAYKHSPYKLKYPLAES